NRVPDAGAAQLIFSNLERVSRRHVGAPLEFLGYVPRDERLERAARLLQPVVTAFPAAPAAAAFRASSPALVQTPHAGQRGRDGLLKRLIAAVPGELTREAA